jgi:hypothetical protein
MMQSAIPTLIDVHPGDCQVEGEAQAISTSPNQPALLQTKFSFGSFS